MAGRYQFARNTKYFLVVIVLNVSRFIDVPKFLGGTARHGTATLRNGPPARSLMHRAAALETGEAGFGFPCIAKVIKRTRSYTVFTRSFTDSIFQLQRSVDRWRFITHAPNMPLGSDPKMIFGSAR
jgi:hypothetical protein